jgi:hypothetical protein
LPCYDPMGKYGVSHTEILESVCWYVVEAIKQQLVQRIKLEYPASHTIQRQIAAAFCEASTVAFDNCAGAIDGLLIWIQKPSTTKEDADCSGVGQKKFFLWSEAQVRPELPSCF